jgi:hypothetical protein
MNSAEDLREALLVVPLPTREKLIGKILLSLIDYRVASRAEQDEVVERATLSFRKFFVASRATVIRRKNMGHFGDVDAPRARINK